MIQGVVNLRCPFCGRPFLTLPQQREALITCPHCAQGAPMSAFQPGGASPAAGALPIPVQRRQLTRPLSQPMTTGFPAQQSAMPPQFMPVNTPFQVAPPAQPPGHRRFQPSAWPPAPEVAVPAWAAQGQPPAAPQMFASAMPQQQAAPTAPAFVPEAPLWQGLQPLEPQPSPFHLPLPSDQGGPVRDYQPDYLDESEPAPARSGIAHRVLLAGGLLVILAGIGWLAVELGGPPIEFRIPAAKPSPSETPSKPPATVAETAVTPQAVEPPPPILAKEDPAPTTPVEVRKAMPTAAATPEVDLALAAKVCPELLKMLFEAPALEEKASVVWQAEQHRAEMDAFFAAHPEPVKVGLLKTASRPTEVFPAKTSAPLFQVVTSANKNGALVRLHALPSGGYQIDWPLFYETHEKHLARFIAQRPDGPIWIRGGIRRSHALDLQESVRANFLAIEIQASADDSSQTLACVKRDSALGRLFDREIPWGQVFLARLLLAAQDLQPGIPGVVILDAEGIGVAPAP